MEYKISIEQDPDPMNPRREWDNLGIMVCFHKRYNLGDPTDLKYTMFDGWDELEQHLFENEKAVVVLPLYLYDHSGITISAGPFSCSWDSGQVGFIYTTEEKIKSWWNAEEVTKELLEKVETQLTSEVSVYDQYLTGDVYGYKILDQDGEELDSCWGFFGHAEAEEQAKDSLQWFKDKQEKISSEKKKALEEIRAKSLSLSAQSKAILIEADLSEKSLAKLEEDYEEINKHIHFLVFGFHKE